MNQLLKLIWSGIWLGSAYAYVAIGLVASFRSVRLVNISVGATFVFSAMLAAWLREAGAGIVVAVAIAALTATVISVAQERLLLRRIAGASPVILLLATLSVAIVLSGIAA